MYLFKNYAVKDWMGFTQVYGMPLPPDWQIRGGGYEGQP
jgi:phage gp29-like protein